MTGSASVVRNGVTVALNNGDTVLQNDVVQTGSGSSLGLVMIDGTTFNLSAGARLMLNDLTYDANSTANSSLLDDRLVVCRRPGAVREGHRDAALLAEGCRSQGWTYSRRTPRLQNIAPPRI